MSKQPANGDVFPAKHVVSGHEPYPLLYSKFIHLPSRLGFP